MKKLLTVPGRFEAVRCREKRGVPTAAGGRKESPSPESGLLGLLHPVS